MLLKLQDVITCLGNQAVIQESRQAYPEDHLYFALAMVSTHQTQAFQTLLPENCSSNHSGWLP